MTGVAAYPTAPPRPRPLTVPRSLLFFLPGIAVGMLWLAPVFHAPGGPSLAGSGSPLARYLRVLSVAVLLPFIAGRLLPSLARERVLRAAVVAFVALPFLSVVNYPALSFAVGTVGPYAVGGASLLCLAALRDDEFGHWLRGVGAVAACFVGAGLLRYGLEMTAFYGRPRAHLGFEHPTQGASALCAAALYAALLVASRRRTPRLVRRLALFTLTAATAWLLVLISSRNTLLLVAVTLAVAAFGRVARGAVPRLTVLLSILALFPAILLYAVRGNSYSPVWQLANVVSSFRLAIYRDMLLSLAREDTFSLLFGPTNLVREMKADTTAGFAVVDSTYFTILLNYGVITTLAFYAFWLLVGVRICRRGRPLDYGVFCAVSSYLLLDAQGVTPSNMLVFALIAHSVRVALRGRQAPSAAA